MLPNPDLEPQPIPHSPMMSERLLALLEVLICSDYPTQFVLASLLAGFGYGPYGPDGSLRFSYIVALSFLDAAVLIALIFALLLAHGERPRDLLLDRRPIMREASLGIPMIFMAIVLGILVLVPIQRFAPWLRTVPHNPFEAVLRSRRHALLFGVVVIVAGGVREEIQRAFILNRFERWLGGGAVGIVIASAAFGAGHLLQGADAAIATGVLGAFWGVVYLRRRSIVAPMISHAGFDLLQIVGSIAGPL